MTRTRLRATPRRLPEQPLGAASPPSKVKPAAGRGRAAAPAGMREEKVPIKGQGTAGARTAAAVVHLLGPPHVRLVDGEQVALERRDAALLAWLALQGQTSRRRLLELLWPGQDPDTARNGLRQRLFKLRTRTGLELTAGGEMVAIAATVPVDVRQADWGSLGAGAILLEGCEYADCGAFADWLTSQREVLAGRRRQALAERADAAEREGRLAEALQSAQQLIESDPLQEAAHRRLMRLHYLRGDRAAALAAFDRCEAVLKDELSARPAPETVALRQVIEASGAPLALAPARALPASLIRPPRLIGRAGTLQAMSGAWVAGHPVLLLGEAGIGKSRSLAEFAAAWPGVIVASARPGDDNMPYATLARVLRALGDLPDKPIADDARRVLAHVLPELATAESLGDAGTRIDGAALQQAAEQMLAAALECGVRAMVVDDLHFADPASVEVLGRLHQSERLAALRFAFAQRWAEAVGTAEIWRQQSSAGALIELRLEPLDQSQVGELIDSLALDGLDGARHGALLHRHAGGNPLFILETLKSLLHAGGAAALQGRMPLPVSVAGVIEGRIGRLSPPALALARVAAVAGTDFNVEMAAQILQQRVVDLADPWAELEAAQILKGDAFAHDLIYEAVRASVPRVVAATLHREVARWMQAHGAMPARLAEHWWLAGEAHAAGCCWMQAAAHAQRASRRAEEARLLERAVEAFRASDDLDSEIECLEQLLPALSNTEVGPRLDRAIERAHQCAGNPEQRLRMLVACGLADFHSGRIQRSVETAREALALAETLGQAAAGYQAARIIGVGSTIIGSPADALEILERQRGWVEVHGTADNRAEFAGDRGWALVSLGRLREARATFEQALAILTELDSTADTCSTLHSLAQVSVRMGRCRDALAYCESAFRLYDRIGNTQGSSTYAYLTAGIASLRMCHYREALRLLQEALRNFEAMRTERWAGSARHFLAVAYSELGQVARAQQVAAPELQTDPANALPRHFELKAALAEAQGVNPTAEHRQALALLGEHGNSTVLNRRETALLGCARWNPAATTDEFDPLVVDAEKWDKSGLLIAALALRAQVEPRPERAAADARRSLQLLEHFEPEGIYRGEVWALAATALVRSGAPEDARRAIDEGARWVEATARDHVPEEFRDSFLNRNRANLELRRAAGRRRLGR